jgi:MFS family permease
MRCSIGPRWACAFFFGVVGVVYGAVVSRMPAIKAQTGMGDADVGFVLLCMGLGALSSFPLAGLTLSRVSCRLVQIAAAAVLLLLFPCVGLASSVMQACILFALLGFAVGFNDVAINTGSILVESAMRRPVISSMHALFSAGGLLGALSSSAMVALGVAPLGNFAAVALLLMAVLPLFACQLLRDEPRPAAKQERLRRPPLWIVLFGLILLCAYSSEGAAGEWGALLLHDVKGSSEELAALVYASFSVAMVVMRFFGDRLRERFGDVSLMRVCTGCALGGIVLALLAPWAWLSLLGFGLMGTGLSVIVPIVFSAAGRRCEQEGGIPTGTATAFLSMMAASGQLFIPPLIGMLGGAVGLQWALLVVVFLCAFMFLNAGAVRR